MQSKVKQFHSKQNAENYIKTKSRLTLLIKAISQALKPNFFLKKLIITTSS